MSIQFKSATPSPYGISEVDPQEVFDRRKEIQIIDVRGADEYHGDLGHIGGAKLVPMDVLQEQLPSFKKDETYVFVCKAGSRSAYAAAYAHSLGFETVYNMGGGMILWNEMGLELAVD